MKIMNIADLRIGNYVEYNGMSAVVAGLLSPKPRKPESFNSVPVVELFCGGLINSLLSEINPIKITEEILLRFGFEKDGDFKYIFFGEITNYVLDEDIAGTYQVGVNHGSCTNFFSWDIKYMHQLQNLLYAITGKELEVKL